MLVLSRKIGEVITVGSSVKVTVLSYDRGVVRLGIEAPKSIPVHRKEVHDKIVEMNKKAAKTQLQAFKDAISSNSVAFDQNKLSKVAKNQLANAALITNESTKKDTILNSIVKSKNEIIEINVFVGEELNENIDLISNDKVNADKANSDKISTDKVNTEKSINFKTKKKVISNKNNIINRK